MSIGIRRPHEAVDYASLSAKGARGAQRFALLVMSEDHGATIREVAPPTQ